MICIFMDGRILYDENMLTDDDIGTYIQVESLPVIEKIEGKVGVITGYNLDTKEIVIEYFDVSPPEPEPTPAPEDIISAANTAKLNEILLLLKGVV